MARTSITGAKAEILACLAANTGTGVPASTLTSYVVRVFDHEPKAGDIPKPGAVTVVTTGLTPDFYQIGVRIYQTLDVGAKAAQDNLDAAILAVETLLSSGFGPSEWSVQIDGELGVTWAEMSLMVGREDSR